jgi:hypothetical protein
MADEQVPRRPIGWWLKEADKRLDAAFDRRLESRGVDRRAWQMLAPLASRPMTRSELADSLASFDARAVLDDVVVGLHERNWVEQSAELLRLTEEGEHEHAALVPLVNDVRQLVAAALPPDEYGTLVRLLQQLVAALEAPNSTLPLSQ